MMREEEKIIWFIFLVKSLISCCWIEMTRSRVGTRGVVCMEHVKGSKIVFRDSFFFAAACNELWTLWSSLFHSNSLLPFYCSCWAEFLSPTRSERDERYLRFQILPIIEMQRTDHPLSHSWKTEKSFSLHFASPPMSTAVVVCFVCSTAAESVRFYIPFLLFIV